MAAIQKIKTVSAPSKNVDLVLKAKSANVMVGSKTHMLVEMTVDQSCIANIVDAFGADAILDFIGTKAINDFLK